MPMITDEVQRAQTALRALRSLASPGARAQFALQIHREDWYALLASRHRPEITFGQEDGGAPAFMGFRVLLVGG